MIGGSDRCDCNSSRVCIDPSHASQPYTPNNAVYATSERLMGGVRHNHPRKVPIGPYRRIGWSEASNIRANEPIHGMNTIQFDE